MFIELLALIAAIINFIIALLKAGEKPASIVSMAADKFKVPASIIEKLLRSIK